MSFFDQPLFWLLSLAALVSAAAPARMRSITRSKLLSAILAWSTALIILHSTVAPSAAVVTAFTSIVIGLTLFVVSLFAGGIRSMANRRYEER